MREDKEDEEEHAGERETNKGYAIMKKMGWRGKGTGLGKESEGIAEPIKASENEGRLGLGRRELEEELCASATKRVPMPPEEISMSEDDRLKRELLAERERLIREEISQAKRSFHCDLCDKQYSNAAQFEGHLRGLGHNHQKRSLEARQAEKLANAIPQTERHRREQKSDQSSENCERACRGNHQHGQ